MIPRAPWFGGDYNPEQWPREVWDDDIRLMQRAGVTVATVGVFSWAHLETADGEFDFEWLDAIIEKLHAAGIGVDLATATASPPPWLVLAHPDILPVTADGVTLGVGSRQHYSPSSATYRRYARRLVEKLVERYGHHPALVAWHTNNEYGCHVSRCYSDESATAFRGWLQEKYGTIAALNDAWGTAFWSQRYGSFDEVMPPRAMPSFPNPTQLLDFDRFSSDALLDLHRMEVEVIRAGSDAPITTNFMGLFEPLDYWKWAEQVDFVSDDFYPDPADESSVIVAAMHRDLMRSLGGGKPWMLMEQATSAVNWRTRNAPKSDSQYRLVSLQSVARGSDGLMHFQWRQSNRGAEKFHSGMVPHGGEDTRVFRRVEAMGAELAGLADVMGTEIEAKVAIVLDWDSWWALRQAANPAQLDYRRSVFAWYRALWEKHVTVDFARPGADLCGYDLVVVPTLQVVTDAALAAVAEAHAAGATVAVTYQSAILNDTLGVVDGGYLGSWQDLLGVHVEEFAPYAFPDQFEDAPAGAPTTTIAGELSGTASGWSEIVHATDAEVRATFTEGIAAGGPAITRRSGEAAAWYIATQPEGELMGAIADALLADAGVTPLVATDEPRLEAVLRGGKLFLLNHSDEDATVSVGSTELQVAAGEAVILSLD